MAKKLSRAEKIRRYVTAHPTVSTRDVAAKFNTTYQIVYMVKRDMQEKSLVDKVTMTSKEAELAHKVGLTTEEYAKKKAKPELLPEVDDGYVYRWLNTHAMSEEAKDALASQLTQNDPVNHPAHYKTGGIETIDFIEAKDLNYNMGNAVKYISRAEHKGNKKQDLEKAVWYLNREISKL
jgi:Protein of unknwon function (DUF3310)